MNIMGRLRFLHRAWKARRQKERAEIASLLARIHPGDTVVDIGAHKGSYLYWLRHAVGSSGKVLAFEPQPALANYLQDAVESAGWQNVTVYNQGVSMKPGFLELHVPGTSGNVSPGASFETAAATRGESHPLRIEVVSLDTLFTKSNAPTFIKCDVEGHEMAVFLGGELLLRRAHPTLLFECEARHLNGKPVRAVLQLLEDWGYAGHFFGTHGLQPVSEFNEDVHQNATGDRFWDRPDYCNNFLFSAL